MTVDHNTVVQTGNVITAYGRSRGAFIKIPGFRFTNNVAPHNAYGIFGSSAGYGSQRHHCLFSRQCDRVECSRRRSAVAISGRELLSVGCAAEGRFHRRGEGNYRLSPRSAYRRAAKDGTDLGVNIDELSRALAGRDR